MEGNLCQPKEIGGDSNRIFFGGWVDLKKIWKNLRRNSGDQDLKSHQIGLTGALEPPQHCHHKSQGGIISDEMTYG
jgi:hypothetical protein